MAHIVVRVRPSSSKDALAWDAWRHCWVVSCRAAPREGAANEAVASMLADWLSVPRSSVGWVRAGRSRSKLFRADGITEVEADTRLRARIRTQMSRRPTGP